MLQTAILVGTGLVLAATLRELRRAELQRARVGWVVTEAGRAALAGSHAATHTRTRPKRTAGELLVIAARELADAAAMLDLNAPAWAQRARHLARTVQATEARRRRYQRAKGTPTSLDRPGTRRAVVLEDARLAVTA